MFKLSHAVSCLRVKVYLSSSSSRSTVHEREEGGRGWGEDRWGIGKEEYDVLIATAAFCNFHLPPAPHPLPLTPSHSLSPPRCALGKHRDGTVRSVSSADGGRIEAGLSAGVHRRGDTGPPALVWGERGD